MRLEFDPGVSGNRQNNGHAFPPTWRKIVTDEKRTGGLASMLVPKLHACAAT